MSWRNICTTGFLYAKRDDRRKLGQVLKKNFRWVHWHGDGRKGHGWYTMMERDLGDYEMELLWMPEIVEQLHNVIQHGWNLAIAWETDAHKVSIHRIRGYLEK